MRDASRAKLTRLPAAPHMDCLQYLFACQLTASITEQLSAAHKLCVEQVYEVSNEVVEVKEEAELLRLQMEVAQQEEEAARAALAAAQAALAAALAAPDESADAPEPLVLSNSAVIHSQVPFMPLKTGWSCTSSAD